MWYLIDLIQFRYLYTSDTVLYLPQYLRTYLAFWTQFGRKNILSKCYKGERRHILISTHLLLGLTGWQVWIFLVRTPALVIFSPPFQTRPGHTQPTIRWVLGLFSQGINLIGHSNIAPVLKKEQSYASTPPLSRDGRSRVLAVGSAFDIDLWPWH